MELTRKTVSATVATLWSNPESARTVDEKAIHNPVDLEGWLDQLSYSSSLALCDENRVQSQVLYGDEVLILEEKNDWSHVIVPSQPSSKDPRGYPGWIPTEQLSEEIYDGDGVYVSIIKHGAAVTNQGDDKMHLSYQTRLPLIDHTIDEYRVWTPHGDSLIKKEHSELVEVNGDVGNGDELVKNAEKFIGLLYLWGGMSSYGYDCSGFSYNMARSIGCTIPRDAHDQMKSGERVQDGNWDVGDLLFFAYEKGKGSVHHVGMYYGDGKMIHSPSTGRIIEITPLKGTIYEEELCGVRRYWGN
ncbi:C40 family peptidase [Alkalihalobacillus sp. CinArs1]|uniref:C40 family peptidase n=1 Tax=Alkalihalobacillus sp. CinArs1 TaxID=2995314 RepID=UPI0022DD1F15|nr:C40 family peptidase [Alkalihalobacillus sp. CinArs1]